MVTRKNILDAAKKVSLAASYGNEEEVLNLVRMICSIEETSTSQGVVYTERYMMPKGRETYSRDHAIMAWRLKVKI